MLLNKPDILNYKGKTSQLSGVPIYVVITSHISKVYDTKVFLSTMNTFILNPTKFVNMIQNVNFHKVLLYNNL